MNTNTHMETVMSDKTIADVFESYWKHLCDCHGANADGYVFGPMTTERHPTTIARLRPIMKVMCTLYGDMSVSGFRAEQLEHVLQVMGRTKVGSAGRDVTLCRTEINRGLATFRGMTRWAVASGMAGDGLVREVRSVEPIRQHAMGFREGAAIEPVTESDIEQVLALSTPTLAGILRLLYLTAMQATEACVLRMADVDTAGDVWTYRPPPTSKSKTGRTVLLAREAQDALRQHIPARPEDYVFTPERAYREAMVSRRSDPGVSTWKRRHPLTKGATFNERYSVGSLKWSLTRTCRRAAVAAKVAGRPFTPWCLRRLRLTAGLRLRDRLGIDGARVLLGHADASDHHPEHYAAQLNALA